MSEFQGAASTATSGASGHPEQWELFELLTEGSTELNAHVKAHVATGCPSCGKHIADIRTVSRAREMKEEFDAFFDELPQDDAPPSEREEFLLKFKKKNRPADRLGRLAHDGRQIADEIVKAVSEEGFERAKELLAKIESDPSRGYAYLYACQLAGPKVSSDPAMYVDFASAMADSTRSLPYLKDRGPAQPVCREQVMGEAALLQSNALNYLGRPEESRRAARVARIRFIEAQEDTFALALTDYFEGSAASFEGDYKAAWRLLRAALSEFRLYGQENWAGRSQAALGTLLLNRNKNESAIHCFDEALRTLHPVLDEAAYGYTLSNRAGSLMLLGRLDSAKAAYAKALGFARRLNMKVGVFQIRYGLACIELKRNRVERALQSFERIALDARAEKLSQRLLSAELRAAECQGILGKTAEMLRRIGELRHAGTVDTVNCDPPLRDLFSRFDEQSVSLELVAHVIEHLDAQDRGVRAAYKPFRGAANGS